LKKEKVEVVVRNTKNTKHHLAGGNWGYWKKNQEPETKKGNYKERVKNSHSEGVLVWEPGGRHKERGGKKKELILKGHHTPGGKKLQ